MTQQGDVKLFQTDNDGDIEVVDGLVVMSSGLETAAYLSLFGGNEDDDGRPDNPKQWWGNLGAEPDEVQRSETQYLLEQLPATTGNLKRLQDAALRDLAWFKTVGAASSVSVTTTIPGLNRIKFVIEIKAFGDESTFIFSQNWKATAQ